MHLNSNDIFTQIGLVVSPQRQYSFEEQTLYTVYLEIQLSEGNNELLEIRNYDNPHIIATSFCRKHKLNELAVGIVENKIKEAMRKEQQRVNGRHKTVNESFKQQRGVEEKKKVQLIKNNIISRNKQQFQLKHQNAVSNEKNKSKSKTNIQQSSKTRHLIKKTQNSPYMHQVKNKIQQRKKQIQQSPSKSQIKKSTNSPNKSQLTKNNISPNKNLSKSITNKQINRKNQDPSVHQFNIHQNKKKNPNIGNELYEKAMTRMKTHQNLRLKKKEQQQKQIQKQLTFQPKINPISAKIVEFRRQNPYPYQKTEKQNKKQMMNHEIAQNQLGQLRECTFKPQINKVSDLILQNNHSYSIDYDHFNALYKQAQTKNSRAIAKIQKETQSLFQPKINPKSTQVVTETFQQRLQRSLIQKKKCIEAPLDESSYTFHPKIGRAPKQKIQRNQPQFWNNLHSEKLKRNKTTTVINEIQEIQPFTISSTSHNYYQNLIEKRMNQVFDALDGDKDGFISPQKISIQNLTKNQLIFLKPIFQEMDELQAVLNQLQFKRALGIMLSESDPYSKGLFLSDKPKIQEKSSFIPQINNKSKQIAHSRLIDSSGNIHQQLYEIGLKKIQKKQYQLQKQRAKIQQKQLQGCSFKPQLNNTSKYYIQKLLGKKMNEKFDDQPIFR